MKVLIGNIWCDVPDESTPVPQQSNKELVSHPPVTEVPRELEIQLIKKVKSKRKEKGLDKK